MQTAREIVSILDITKIQYNTVLDMTLLMVTYSNDENEDDGINQVPMVWFEVNDRDSGSSISVSNTVYETVFPSYLDVNTKPMNIFISILILNFLR